MSSRSVACCREQLILRRLGELGSTLEHGGTVRQVLNAHDIAPRLPRTTTPHPRTTREFPVILPNSRPLRDHAIHGKEAYGKQLAAVDSPGM